MTGPSATLYCSFCGKSQHEVDQIVAGPAVFICDCCTDICEGIRQEFRERKGIQKTPLDSERCAAKLERVCDLLIAKLSTEASAA